MWKDTIKKAAINDDSYAEVNKVIEEEKIDHNIFDGNTALFYFLVPNQQIPELMAKILKGHTPELKKELDSILMEIMKENEVDNINAVIEAHKN